MTWYALAFFAMLVVSFWLVWPEVGPIYKEMLRSVK
jgi:hypothetical protein